ncbi:MAG: hypothetical protein BZ138_01775 [Methanosphaera sp. rholeuAM270]|nr:MAG: hypothetical protein BZ138_01775 [Methanosphaera sp. rholeuAM270]
MSLPIIIHTKNYYDIMYEKVLLSKLDTSCLKDQFYTVLSVELGNTTIKSIIVSTNIKTNRSYQINKAVYLTRNIRLPKDNERVFGHTIWDKQLSKEAIEETITRIILDSLGQVNLTVDDLDFVVRSTGVIAISNLSGEMGLIIKALSDACLNAGIKPSQMTAPFVLDNIPEHIRNYSFFNTIKFDGSVVSVSPPDTTGVLSNEMEGDLVTAGIKLASKESSVDYRNPVVSIDMGTTLAGQVTDNSKPYANVVCNFVGLAGGISDVILRGCEIIETKQSTIDVENNEDATEYNHKQLHDNTIRLHEFIDIMEVPVKTKEFGLVCVSASDKINTKVKIIGAKINDEKELVENFKELVNTANINEVMLQIDYIYSYYIKRLIDETEKLGLITKDMTIGITGRAGTTGNKPELINKYLHGEYDIIFVEDGLSLGALMMARCMNSLGTPINPIGGSRNGYCIMQQRINKK